MSFSSKVKEKLCSVPYICPNCSVYESAGALWQSGAVGDGYIKFTTENRTSAERISADIKEAFGISAPVRAVSKMYRIEVSDLFEAENIIGGISPYGDIPFSCCRQAFARGAFLCGGSVTDPDKSYHLEFGSKNLSHLKELQTFLSVDGFEAKITERKGYYILYLKESEKIADLLSYMGAPQGALRLYSVQIEKDMRNTVNRRVNFENANTDKLAKASSKHRYAIAKIKKAKKWDRLPDVLKEIGRLREDHPEASLKELGEMVDPPIGKSGVNHRLNRILDLADNINMQRS